MADYFLRVFLGGGKVEKKVEIVSTVKKTSPYYPQPRVTLSLNYHEQNANGRGKNIMAP